MQLKTSKENKENIYLVSIVLDSAVQEIALCFGGLNV